MHTPRNKHDANSVLHALFEPQGGGVEQSRSALMTQPIPRRTCAPVVD